MYIYIYIYTIYYFFASVYVYMGFWGFRVSLNPNGNILRMILASGHNLPWQVARLQLPDVPGAGVEPGPPASCY